MTPQKELSLIAAANSLDQPFTTDELLQAAKLRATGTARREAIAVLEGAGWSRSNQRRPYDKRAIKGWTHAMEEAQVGAAQLLNGGEESLSRDEPESEEGRLRRQLDNAFDEMNILARQRDQAVATAKVLGEQATTFQERWAAALCAGGFIRASEVPALANREQSLTNLGLTRIEQMYAPSAMQVAGEARRGL